MASEVDILKTKAANKKGAGSEEVETVWPKPEFVRFSLFSYHGDVDSRKQGDLRVALLAKGAESRSRVT